MEKKIYLIFSDNFDTLCEIKGYIRGTEAEAQAYCEELNKTKGKQLKDFVWMELPLLATHECKATMSDQFTTVQKTAEKWGINRVYVLKYCREGRIPGVKRVGRNWYIPVDAQKPADDRTKRLLRHISAKKASEKWNVSLSFVCKAAREGRIAGAEFIDGKWHIPEDAVCPEDERGKRR